MEGNFELSPRSLSHLLLVFFNLLFFAFLPVSCGRFGDKDSTEKKDGKLRIVFISKQLTEIIFAVGGDSALVGVDISITYPEAAKKITTVGYHRALSGADYTD
jgi:iron complex transport system substrate-binding protein